MRRFLKRKLNMAIILTLFVFVVMLLSSFLVGIVMNTLLRREIMRNEELNPRFYDEPPDMAAGKGMMDIRGTLSPMVLTQSLVVCVVLGTGLAFFLSKFLLKPIKKVAGAIQEVAQGNFDVRVPSGGFGELADLKDGFNKMAQELSGTQTLRADFVNNLSHEFKTPIVSIRGFAKLLHNGGIDAQEQEEYLKIIIQESERLAVLSTNILNLSKYESLEIISDKRPYRMDEQVRRAILLMEPKWSEKGIAFNIELDAVEFVGNEDLTLQMWLNLLDNAVKFCGDGGHVDVKLESSEDRVLFTITDDGPGIDDADAGRIFDKFFQGQNSEGKAGNGLGLAMVKRIATLYGGGVEVKSEAGKGVTFTVRLKNS